MKPTAPVIAEGHHTLLMKTTIPEQPPRALARGRTGSRASIALALFLSLSCAAGRAATLPAVSTLSGGPSQGHPTSYGYVDGDTENLAQFHTPMGLALDRAGCNGPGPLPYVGDRGHHAGPELHLDP